MAGKTESTVDREIVLVRVVDAPRERVWEAWTDPKQIDAWWGPKGFSNETKSMSVKAGGSWDYIMHGPDGKDWPNFIAYKEVIKPRLLVYDHGSGPNSPPEFHTVVTFAALGSRTQITMRAVFPSAAIRDGLIKAVDAIEGGKQNMARLAEHLGKPPAHLFEFERVVSAPPQRVWEAWTKPEQLARWFAPKPFQLVISKMDLKVGGRFSMAMRGPDGGDFPFEGIYHIVEPGVQIAWTSEFPGGPPDQHSTVVSFDDLGGKTRVRAVQTFHVSSPTIEAAVKGAQQGWNMTLDQLRAYCEG